MDVSAASGGSRRLANGTFEPGEPHEDASVVVEETPFDETSMSQQFYDCRSTDNSFEVTTQSSSSKPKKKKKPRRPSDVGSIPLNSYVGAVVLDSILNCHRVLLLILLSP